tara:strand:- start:2071 stop:2406 length:336 start_codon:yes stop_codon:yes gene_type:complete
MDTSKKFLFVNPDNTAGEFDSSKLFPVSSLQGIQELNATSVRLAVSDFGQADDTLIDITVDSGTAKTYIKDLVEAINFAKQSVINLADASDETSFSPDVDFGTDPVITVGA